jgi:secondary thiamine-phosphate synthase enzyme
VKASLFGPSLTIPISEGRLALGTWQGIYFAEFDGPRSRNYHVTILGEHR